MKFGEILCSGTRDNENSEILRKCSITAPPSGQLALLVNNIINIFLYNKDHNYQVWFNSIQQN